MENKEIRTEELMNKPDTEPTSPATDDFGDLSGLRMSQEFAENLGVEKLLSKVVVGKPDKQSYFQVHSDPTYRLDTAAIQLKSKKETYLVARPLWKDLGPEIVRMMLFTAITRQGVLFVWPVQLPGPDGKHHDAHQVQLDTAMKAMGTWMRLTWNEETRAYEVFKSGAELSEPKWPKKSFEEILRAAFKDRLIKSLEHPVLQELRGEK